MLINHLKKFCQHFSMSFVCLYTHKTVTRNNTFFHSLVVVSHNHTSFRGLWYRDVCGPNPPTITNNGPDNWVAEWWLLFWGHSTEWPIDVLMLLQCWGEEQIQSIFRHHICWNTHTTHARKEEKGCCYSSKVQPHCYKKTPELAAFTFSVQKIWNRGYRCLYTQKFFDKFFLKHRTLVWAFIYSGFISPCKLGKAKSVKHRHDYCHSHHSLYTP